MPIHFNRTAANDDLIEGYLGTESPDLFESVEEIEDYFSPKNLKKMFGPGDYSDAEEAKQAVISEWENRKRTAADEPKPAATEVEAEDTEEEVDLTAEQVAEKLGEEYGWGNELALAVAEMLEAEDLSMDDIKDSKNFSGFETSGEYCSVSTTSGRSAWLVCDVYETAEELAVAVVTQTLEDEPEMFSQDWLSSHIDTDKLKSDLMQDVLNARIDDLNDQADRDLEGLAEELGLDLDDYRAEPEVDEDGDETEGEIDEAELRSAVTDGIEVYAEKLAEDELADPVEYLKDMGSTDLLKSYIDVEAAAQDAVDTDGAAHFLNTYDGNQNDLSSGGVYFRTN